MNNGSIDEEYGVDGNPPANTSDRTISIGYGYFTDLIAEGEIGGIYLDNENTVNDADLKKEMEKSIFLDEVPIHDGVKRILDDAKFETNFFKTGKSNPNQEPLPWPYSSPQIPILSRSQSSPLKAGLPYVVRLNSKLYPDINEVLVSIKFGQFSDSVDAQNPPKRTTVHFTISVYRDGETSPIARRTVSVKAKTSDAFVRSYAIPLERSDRSVTFWKIEVVRTTPNSRSTRLQNDIYVDGFMGMSDYTYSYPNSALACMRLSAETYPSPPNRTYLCKMLKVKIPSNYTPYNFNRDGSIKTNCSYNPPSWDGKFKTEKVWTSNPAWIFYDILTNDRYGIGQYMSGASVDKFTLYAIAKYCDEQVDNENGDKEPRFTCNILLEDEKEAFEIINNFASVFRGMVYWMSNTVFVSIDKDKEPSQFFTNANVVNGVFSYSGSDDIQKRSVAIVQWQDPEDFFRNKFERIEEPELIFKMGVREMKMSAFGCTSRGQARRIGKWALMSENLEDEVVTFEVGVEGWSCLPGHIIKIRDNFRENVDRGGRILERLNSTTLILDRPLTVTNGTILIKVPADRKSSAFSEIAQGMSVYSEADADTAENPMLVKCIFSGGTVTSSGFFQINVSPPAPAGCVGMPWVIDEEGSSGEEAKEYRVVGIEETDNEETIKVSALLFDKRKFSDIDTDSVIVTPTPQPPPPPSPPRPATDLSISIISGCIEPSGMPRAEISWTLSPDTFIHRLYIKHESEATFSNAVSNISSADFFPTELGQYTVRVVAYNTSGEASTDLDGTFLIDETDFCLTESADVIFDLSEINEDDRVYSIARHQTSASAPPTTDNNISYPIYISEGEFLNIKWYKNPNVFASGIGTVYKISLYEMRGRDFHYHYEAGNSNWNVMPEDHWSFGSFELGGLQLQNCVKIIDGFEIETESLMSAVDSYVRDLSNPMPPNSSGNIFPQELRSEIGYDILKILSFYGRRFALFVSFKNSILDTFGQSSCLHMFFPPQPSVEMEFSSGVENTFSAFLSTREGLNSYIGNAPDNDIGAGIQPGDFGQKPWFSLGRSTTIGSGMQELPLEVRWKKKAGEEQSYFVLSNAAEDPIQESMYVGANLKTVWSSNGTPLPFQLMNIPHQQADDGNVWLAVNFKDSFKEDDYYKPDFRRFVISAGPPVNLDGTVNATIERFSNGLYTGNRIVVTWNYPTDPEDVRAEKSVIGHNVYFFVDTSSAARMQDGTPIPYDYTKPFHTIFVAATQTDGWDLEAHKGYRVEWEDPVYDTDIVCRVSKKMSNGADLFLDASATIKIDWTSQPKVVPEAITSEDLLMDDMSSLVYNPSFKFPENDDSARPLGWNYSWQNFPYEDENGNTVHPLPGIAPFERSSAYGNVSYTLPPNSITVGDFGIRGKGYYWGVGPNGQIRYQGGDINTGWPQYIAIGSRSKIPVFAGEKILLRAYVRGDNMFAQLSFYDGNGRWLGASSSEGGFETQNHTSWTDYSGKQLLKCEPFSSSKIYRCGNKFQSAVLHNNQVYVAINADKDGSSNWATPPNATDWALWTNEAAVAPDTLWEVVERIVSVPDYAQGAQLEVLKGPGYRMGYCSFAAAYKIKDKNLIEDKIGEPNVQPKTRNFDGTLEISPPAVPLEHNLRYTVDGSEVNWLNSAPWHNPISISKTTYLRARFFDRYNNGGREYHGVYIKNLEISALPSLPTITPLAQVNTTFDSVELHYTYEGESTDVVSYMFYGSDDSVPASWTAWENDGPNGIPIDKTVAAYNSYNFLVKVERADHNTSYGSLVINVEGPSQPIGTDPNLLIWWSSASEFSITVSISHAWEDVTVEYRIYEAGGSGSWETVATEHTGSLSRSVATEPSTTYTLDVLISKEDGENANGSISITTPTWSGGGGGGGGGEIPININ